jgi:hypothetical protein
MLVNREGPTFAAGGAFVTLPGVWNANDQEYIAYYQKKHREFVTAFCGELERLGMFKKAEIFAELPTMPTMPTWVDSPTARSRTSDVPITIHYVTTTFDSAHMNGYTLDVVLTIGSDKAFVREYHIDSAKGDSLWTKFNTNGAQSRQKADAQLVNALIEDVQVWLKGDTAGG